MCSSIETDIKEEIDELKYLIKESINRLGVNNRNVKIYKLRLDLNEEYLKIIQDGRKQEDSNNIS